MARTTFYQKNYAQWPPVKLTELADPDSCHWENSARNKKVLLIQAIGEDEYLEWIERLFPGEDNGPSSWKELCDLLGAKLLVIQGIEKDVERHDWMNDPKHLKTNGVF